MEILAPILDEGISGQFGSMIGKAINYWIVNSSNMDQLCISYPLQEVNNMKLKLLDDQIVQTNYFFGLCDDKEGVPNK